MEFGASERVLVQFFALLLFVSSFFFFFWVTYFCYVISHLIWPVFQVLGNRRDGGSG